MTGIDSWSTTPATNAIADAGAINWAEGQAPSTVNNTARQMLTDTRAAFNDLAWFQYGTGDQGAGNIAVPAVYSSSTVFTIAGADVTAAYHVGRRLRAVGVSTGTIYGRISVTSYAPTTTTVTAVWDSGSLSNETLVVSLSQIPITGNPVAFSSGIFTPAGLLVGSKTNIADMDNSGGQIGAFRGFYTTAGNGIDWSTTTYMRSTSGVSVDVTCGANGVTLLAAAAAWSALSDERLKSAFTPFVDAMAKVASIKCGMGRYLTEEEGVSHPFLSAQSVQAVLPDAVSEHEGFLQLRYTEVIPLLVAALAEARARIEILENHKGT